MEGPDSGEKSVINSGRERDVEEDRESLILDSTEVQFCPRNKESKDLFKDTLAVSKFEDKTTTRANVEDANQPSQEGRVWNGYENPVSLRSTVPQSCCHGDEPDDDEVSAKDLIGFAWQISRGMVSSNRKTIGNRPAGGPEHMSEVRLLKSHLEMNYF